MAKEWSVHNGKKYLAAMQLTDPDPEPDDTLRLVFNALDKHTNHKMSVWILSPYTEPNPDAFTFSR